MNVRVKICCIASLAEAERAVAAGADAVGLVSAMPSGPGQIPDHRIAEIASALPATVDTFLLTSRQDAASIATQLRAFPVSTVQLCDRLEDDAYDQLRTKVPGIRIVQVIHVTGESAVQDAQQVQSRVDAVLLDSGSPSASAKRLGGTGEVHDWAVSRRIRDLMEVPVYLAGGLRPDNVEAAIRQVCPHAVDVCSGVRTDDILDEDKLSAFIRSVRRGLCL